jgi:hypothetical protein
LLVVLTLLLGRLEHFTNPGHRPTHFHRRKNEANADAIIIEMKLLGRSAR